MESMNIVNLSLYVDLSGTLNKTHELCDVAGD